MHRLVARCWLVGAFLGIMWGVKLLNAIVAFLISGVGVSDVAAVDRGFVSPVGSVLVANYFNPPPRPWDAGFHRGVDLVAGQSSLVLAPSAGVVTFAGSAFGKPVITIVHANGLTSSLEPVVPFALYEDEDFSIIQTDLVRVGDFVEAGAVIGVLSYWPAETGSNATHCPGTTCVHWGVRRGDDAYVDPLWLLGLGAPIVLLPGS